MQDLCPGAGLWSLGLLLCAQACLKTPCAMVFPGEKGTLELNACPNNACDKPLREEVMR